LRPQAAQPAIERLVLETGQQHPAHRGAERRQARADPERNGHHLMHGNALHVHDVVGIEHAERAGLIDAVCHLLHDGLRQHGDAERGEIAEAELEHARGERELPPLVAHVAEMGEGQQQPPCHRP